MTHSPSEMEFGLIDFNADTPDIEDDDTVLTDSE
jgi:hypothetical protein